MTLRDCLQLHHIYLHVYAQASVFACTSAPIRLELQLIDSAIKGVASVGAITGMTVSNVEYVATMIELSDQAMDSYNHL